MTTMFVHLRNSEINHGRVEVAPRGGFTLAVRQNGEHWECGVARCSPEENFVKRTGRLLAYNRLENEQWKMAVGAKIVRNAQEAIAYFVNTVRI